MTQGVVCRIPFFAVIEFLYRNFRALGAIYNPYRVVGAVRMPYTSKYLLMLARHVNLVAIRPLVTVTSLKRT